MIFITRPNVPVTFLFYETSVPCPAAIDKFFCGQAGVPAGINCCVTCTFCFLWHLLKPCNLIFENAK